MNAVKSARGVTACSLFIIAALAAGPALADCCCCECQPGTGTPGYWANHPEAWPVCEIAIGGVTYLKEEAIQIIQAAVRGDKTLTLFPALVAAELNVLIGNCDCCIVCTIMEADAWLTVYPVGSDVRANSDAWQCDGEELYLCLDAYNNGLLCAPSRDEEECDD